MKIIKPKKILILGGGDGLPARQALLYNEIKEITMVDLDPEWVNFTKTDRLMRFNNHDALHNPKLKFYASDAFKWIIETNDKFDAVFVDFPGTTNLASLRIATLQFMNDLKRIINPNGIVITMDDVYIDATMRKHIFTTAKAAGLSILFGERYNTNVVNDYVNQFIGFNNNVQKKYYLDKYYNEYLTSPQNQKKIQKYGRIQYSPFPDEEGEIISYYDPIVLQHTLLNIIENIL